ncbi:MAG: hypothetical protein IPJ03_17350 [Ignavibacteriales bacterium]|nr:hypothetical protein [Ignavibacteriales bacterium]
MVKTIDDARAWHYKHTPYLDNKVIEKIVEEYPKMIKKEILKSVYQET